MVKKVLVFIFLAVFSVGLIFAVETNNVPQKSPQGTQISPTSTENDVIAPVKTTFVQKIENKILGGDMTVALILGLVSVIFFPFALHNWYLGEKKKALWQTLLMFPGCFLIIPAIVSWVWQVIDVVKIITQL